MQMDEHNVGHITEQYPAEHLAKYNAYCYVKKHLLSSFGCLNFTTNQETEIIFRNVVESCVAIIIF